MQFRELVQRSSHISGSVNELEGAGPRELAALAEGAWRPYEVLLHHAVQCRGDSRDLHLKIAEGAADFGKPAVQVALPAVVVGPEVEARVGQNDLERRVTFLGLTAERLAEG